MSYHHVGGVREGGTDQEIVFTCRVNVFGHRRRDPQPRQQNQTCEKQERSFKFKNEIITVSLISVE